MNTIIININVPLSTAVPLLIAVCFTPAVIQLAKVLVVYMITKKEKKLSNKKVESICNMMKCKLHLSKKDS